MGKLRPARDYVILEFEEVKERTRSGLLYIPDTAKDAPSIGTVVAVGPGEYDESKGSPGTEFCFIPLLTKVGERVLFSKYSGHDIEWDGKPLLIVRESEIISYIEE